ncbi:acyl-CoA dehydrogenase N-terminal domain-containing protein, partial [Planktomarina temperata]|nr:acyl-CoA dehydrogenase N-terminal domain-containing protein [Planktomarina temperata]
MPSYSAPIKDQQFILHEVLRLSQSNIPGYSDLDPAFTKAILNESGKLA